MKEKTIITICNCYTDKPLCIAPRIPYCYGRKKIVADTDNKRKAPQCVLSELKTIEVYCG